MLEAENSQLQQQAQELIYLVPQHSSLKTLIPQNIHFLIIFLLFCPFPFKTLQVCDSKSVFCQRIASLSRYSHMSRVTAKSPPFKPPLPQSSIRRTNAKAGSQRTLDTAAPVDLNSQIDTLHRLN